MIIAGYEPTNPEIIEAHRNVASLRRRYNYRVNRIRRRRAGEFVGAGSLRQDLLDARFYANALSEAVRRLYLLSASDIAGVNDDMDWLRNNLN